MDNVIGISGYSLFKYPKKCVPVKKKYVFLFLREHLTVYIVGTFVNPEKALFLKVSYMGV